MFFLFKLKTTILFEWYLKNCQNGLIKMFKIVWKKTSEN